MYRLLISAAAAVCFAATAAGAPFTDHAKGFTVEVPEGWSKEPGGEFPLDLALLSPRRETTAGVCLLMSQEVKFTKELTQVEVNKLVVEQATEEFWRTILTSDKTVQVKDLTIKASQETRGERTIGRATVLVTATRETLTMQLQFEMMLQAVPGNSYLTHCSVKQDQVAAEAGDIKIVIDSHTDGHCRCGRKRATAARRRNPGRRAALAHGRRCVQDEHGRSHEAGSAALIRRKSQCRSKCLKTA